MTFSKTTFGLMTLSIKGLFVTLSIKDIQQKRHSASMTFSKKDTQHNKKGHNSEFRYAECRGAVNITQMAEIRPRNLTVIGKR